MCRNMTEETVLILQMPALSDLAYRNTVGGGKTELSLLRPPVWKLYSCDTCTKYNGLCSSRFKILSLLVYFSSS